MNPKVILSPEAAADLESQLVYLLERDTGAASRLQKAVFNAAQMLLATPALGASRGFISARFKDLRMWPVPGFPLLLIYYVPGSYGRIEIVRLLHAKRDRDGILGDEGASWSRDRRMGVTSQVDMTSIGALSGGRLAALDSGQTVNEVTVEFGLPFRGFALAQTKAMRFPI